MHMCNGVQYRGYVLYCVLVTEDLATTPCNSKKLKSVKCITTMTELIVAWSVCSIGTYTILVATVTHAMLYALPQMLQGVVKVL